MGRHAQDLAVRFWAAVDKNGPIPAHRPELGACWVWQKQIRATGYGGITLALADRELLRQGRDALAHRVAYVLLRGAIADGLHLDHLCLNKACVNPAHLEAVTPLENNRRAQRSHCKHGHEFTPANTIVRHRDGYTSRDCRACNYRQAREYRLRQRLQTPGTREAA